MTTITYTPMARFQSGEFLSANKLNIMSRNIHFLQGLLAKPNVPFMGVVSSADCDNSPATFRAWVRHRYQYFYWDFGSESITTIDTELWFNGVQIDGRNETVPNGIRVIDLHDTGILPTTPTIGQWYEINLHVEKDGDRWWSTFMGEYPTSSFSTVAASGSYVAPPLWHHGDVPDGSDMQKYSDALNYLYNQKGPRINFATCWASTNAPLSLPESQNSGFYFFHVYNWLHYMGQSAVIKDPLDLQDDMSLPETNGTIMTYDLSAVEWLTPGRKYYVDLATMACEEPTPL